MAEAAVKKSQAEIDAEVRKLEAEAEAALRGAETERLKADAEIRKLDAEAEEVRIKSIELQIKADKASHERRKELTHNEHYHTYVFDKAVDAASANACIRQLEIWERMADDKLTVELVINSPGGSVFDGFALFDYIEGFQSRGNILNTYSLGMAASMGGVLLQVGNERAFGRSSALLIHEASFGASGSFGKVEDQVELVKMMQDRILHIFTDRAKGTGRPKAMSYTQLKNRWARKDWWVSAQQAYDYGFIDVIR